MKSVKTKPPEPSRPALRLQKVELLEQLGATQQAIKGLCGQRKPDQARGALLGLLQAQLQRQNSQLSDLEMKIAAQRDLWAAPGSPALVAPPPHPACARFYGAKDAYCVFCGHREGRHWR